MNFEGAGVSRRPSREAAATFFFPRRFAGRSCDPPRLAERSPWEGRLRGEDWTGRAPVEWLLGWRESRAGEEASPRVWGAEMLGTPGPQWPNLAAPQPRCAELARPGGCGAAQTAAALRRRRSDPGLGAGVSGSGGPWSPEFGAGDSLGAGSEPSVPEKSGASRGEGRSGRWPAEGGPQEVPFLSLFFW